MLTTVTLLAIAGLAAAHGEVTSPKPRRSGSNYIASCGQQAANNMGNPQGNVQGILNIAKSQPDYNPATCNLFLCKGFKAADNTANIQSYTAGQTVDFKVTIGAPHTGVMNVSVVNTASNTVIGQPLISMTDYASNQHTIPANNTAFSVTMPDVSSQCGTAGACVLQWFWDARNIDQTYEDCVDFTMGGGGGRAAATAPTTTAAATAAVSSKVAATTTKTAAVTSQAVGASSMVPELDCEPTVIPELDCEPTVIPELDCDDSGFTRRHPRDFRDFEG